MRDKDVFVCYSVPLMKHLQENGFRYKVIGIHPQTHKTFYVFIRSKQLDMELDKWTLNKPV